MPLGTDLLALHAGKCGKLGGCCVHEWRGKWDGRGCPSGSKTGAESGALQGALEVFCGCRAHHCALLASFQPLLLGERLIYIDWIATLSSALCPACSPGMLDTALRILCWWTIASCRGMYLHAPWIAHMDHGSPSHPRGALESSAR